MSLDLQLQQQKKSYRVVSGPHDSFDKLPKKNHRTGNFVIFLFFYLFFLFTCTDKKTRVGRGGDTGSVGLVETWVFFFTPDHSILCKK